MKPPLERHKVPNWAPISVSSASPPSQPPPLSHRSSTRPRQVRAKAQCADFFEGGWGAEVWGGRVSGFEVQSFQGSGIVSLGKVLMSFVYIRRGSIDPRGLYYIGLHRHTPLRVETVPGLLEAGYVARTRQCTSTRGPYSDKANLVAAAGGCSRVFGAFTGLMTSRLSQTSAGRASGGS